MSSDVAIAARGVSKTFQIARTQHRPTTLAELVAQKVRKPFSGRERYADFEALSDVSFDVPQGAVLGIIGRNGAGKSTLLKILSQITPPSRGEIDLYGRVGSLLEVGTGFHPELTGRENIYLNGALLGMRRAEIAAEFDEIVAFAGVEQFLDTPVKRYSSGMYVRLAFAVAAHLHPDILIVDEVLAVGDAEFQQRCIGKMSEITSRQGRTVLFVSHSMPAVQQLCTECLLLDGGRVVARGTPAEMAERYVQAQAEHSESLVHGGAPCRIELRILSATGERTKSWEYGKPLRVRVVLQPEKPLWRPAIDVVFYDGARRRLFAVRSDHLVQGPDDIKTQPWVFECEIANPGFTVPDFVIDVGVRQGTGDYVALFSDAARLVADLSSLGEPPSPGCVLQPEAKAEFTQAA